MSFWNGFDKTANAYLRSIGAIGKKVAPAGAGGPVAGGAAQVAKKAPVQAAAPKVSPYVNRIQADLRARHGGKKYIDIK